MSNLPNFPILRPSLLLDFANSKQVDPRITFTRASTATYYDAQGVLRTAASGVPRIDHDPVTGECKGLLIEEARTNLLTYSEQFDNAVWAKSNTTITPNATTAPDGAITADKLVESADALTKQIYRNPNVSITSGVTYTYSIYLKTGERSKVYGEFSSAAFGASSFRIDLIAGTAIPEGANAPQVNLVSVGSGWFRFSATGTATSTIASNPAVDLRPSVTAGDVGVYTGDGTSGLYIWGVQFEVGNSPSSYIPTTTTAVTRAADAASMTGTNFSEWYRQDEGTFVVDYLCDHIGGPYYPSAWHVDSGVANRFGHSIHNTNKNVVHDSVTSSAGTAYIMHGNTEDNVKAAFAYKQDDMASSVNGSSVLTDTVTAVPVVNSLTIGGRMSGAQLNGTVRRIAFFPRRLANAELQAISS